MAKSMQKLAILTDWKCSKSCLKFKLQEKRLNGEDTDVTIVCKDKSTVKAHKLVLVSASPYFEKMFSGSFMESETNEIQLELEPKTTATVLDFVYLQNDAKIQLDDLDQADTLLHAADMLQMMSLFAACCKTVRQLMTVDHFSKITNWNQLYANEQTKTLLDEYVNTFWGIFLDSEELYLQCDVQQFMLLVEIWSRFNPVRTASTGSCTRHTCCNASLPATPVYPTTHFCCSTNSPREESSYVIFSSGLLRQDAAAAANSSSMFSPRDTFYSSLSPKPTSDPKVDDHQDTQEIIQKIIKWVEHNRDERQASVTLLFSKLEIPRLPSSFVKTLLAEETIKINCEVLMQLFNPFLQ